MLRSRLIPCLLVHEGGLVKTVRFGDPKYVGDPLNAVKIFNEKEVDELTVLDIDATALGKEPDYALIAKLAAECRMPLCYGGGIRTVDQAQRLVAMGVEKVSLSSAALANPGLVTDMARAIGSQSVVVVIDARKRTFGARYQVYGQNGRNATGRAPAEVARQMQDAGAGEIIINSIDNDGVMKGYDLALIEQVREAITLPMTALGGAGSLADARTLWDRFGLMGAAAGSLFVFKGVYRAVLINYPSRAEKDRLLRS